MNRRTTYVLAGTAALVVVVAMIAWIGRAPHRKSAGPAKPGRSSASIASTAPDGSLLQIASDINAEHGNAPDQTRREIRTLQKRFQAAVRQKDVQGVLSLMTPDFTQTTEQGQTRTRRQVEQDVRNNWPTILAINSWTIDLIRLDVNGAAAVGTVREQMIATTRGGNGKPVESTIKARSRITWVRTPSGWRYRRIEYLPADTDGMEFLTAEEWKRENSAIAAARRRQASRAAARAASLSPAEARRTLERLYADYRQAVRRKDTGAVLATLERGYSVEYPAEIHPRWQVEQDLKKDLQAIQSIPEWTMEIGKVDVKDNVITAALTERRTAILNLGANGRHTARTVATMRDTWAKTEGSWKNRRTEMLSARSSMDGKPMR